MITKRLKDSEIYSENGLRKMLEYSKEIYQGLCDDPTLDTEGEVEDWKKHILELEISLKEKINQAKN